MVFKLREVNTSIDLQFASPFNCVYSAKKLAQDPNYPRRSRWEPGAFQFVEYVKGSHWTGKRFDGYFRRTGHTSTASRRSW